MLYDSHIRRTLLAAGQTKIVANLHRKYVKSLHWIRKRRERLDVDGFRCQVCGSTENLEVHHLNYDSLNMEEMRDLVTLCSGCHELVHSGGLVISPKCHHPVRYRPFSAGPWFCFTCEPPARTPNAVGLLQRDGSVLSVAEMAARRRAIAQEGRERAVRALLDAAWPDGGWEVITPACDAQGWPRGSHGGCDYGVKTNPNIWRKK